MACALKKFSPHTNSEKINNPDNTRSRTDYLKHYSMLQMLYLALTSYSAMNMLEGKLTPFSIQAVVPYSHTSRCSVAVFNNNNNNNNNKK